ncbi:DUF1905 domain-containing protein [Salinibacterium sp. TMP30]|uniref:DUF1905 domain-containing protein n=1 Tax=Salinibacterium sp. TMP30 TaxID=3138237 RepID=UPI0031387BCE
MSGANLRAMKPSFEFSSALTVWDAKPNVFLLPVPPDVGASVRDVPIQPRGFGAVAVVVTIGGSTWSTSLFPSSSHDGFWLPVKAAVRLAESIELDDTVTATIQLV